MPNKFDFVQALIQSNSWKKLTLALAYTVPIDSEIDYKVNRQEINSRRN